MANVEKVINDIIQEREIRKTMEAKDNELYNYFWSCTLPYTIAHGINDMLNEMSDEECKLLSYYDDEFSMVVIDLGYFYFDEIFGINPSGRPKIQIDNMENFRLKIFKENEIFLNSLSKYCNISEASIDSNETHFCEILKLKATEDLLRNLTKLEKLKILVEESSNKKIAYNIKLGMGKMDSGDDFF